MTQKSYVTGQEFPPLKPGVLRIYSMRFCPYAHRTRLVLAHKNLQFETVNIHLKKKPEWFLKKNPLGTVPTLEIDDKVLYESTAANEWLDDVYTQNSLQPTDPYRRAWDRIHLEYYGKVTTSFYKLILMGKAEEKDKIIEDLLKHYKYYNDVLAARGGPFFGGNKVSMLDFYVWPHMERLVAVSTREPLIVVSNSKFPQLAHWVQAMSKHPAVKATAFDTETLLHFLDSAIDGAPDYDYKL